MFGETEDTSRCFNFPIDSTYELFFCNFLKSAELEICNDIRESSKSFVGSLTYYAFVWRESEKYFCNKSRERKMSDKLSSYRNYAKKLRALLRFCGLWPARKWNYFSNRLLPLFNLFVSITMSFFVANFCRENFSKLDSLTKGLGLMGSFLSVVLKISCFLVYERDLADVHFTLEKYFKESIDNPDLKSSIFESLGTLTKSFHLLSVLLIAATMMYWVMPIVLIFVQMNHNVSRIKYLLPFPGKIPWTFEGGGFFYWVHYAWEVIAAMFLGCVTCSVDSLFAYYVFQISAVLRLMSHRMKSLSDSDDNYNDVLRDCATKHRAILKCRNQLQIIYGPIVLWTCLTSAVISCSLIFQASQIRHWTIGHAILLTAYISLKLLQALIYAWYGSVLTAESEQFRDAVYSSGWPGSGNKSFMNNILIMMNHKPIFISACKFFVVSTDMFAMILNTTISYFFLLQTIDESK